MGCVKHESTLFFSLFYASICLLSFAYYIINMCTIIDDCWIARQFENINIDTRLDSTITKEYIRKIIVLELQWRVMQFEGGTVSRAANVPIIWLWNFSFFFHEQNRSIMCWYAISCCWIVSGFLYFMYNGALFYA